MIQPALTPSFFENQKIVIISADAPWLPESLRENSRPILHKFSFSKPERKMYRKKKRTEKPSEWAEKNRVITSGPFEGSKMNFQVTPYLRGMLDASFHPSVREITFCSAPQTGKSAVLDTCIGYVADVDPGPALIVYPDQNTAKENSRDRLQTMIRKSPPLAELMTGYEDDLAGLRIKLQSMVIYMGWAGSATSLGNKSIRYLALDEEDKYPLTPNKKEAKTSALAKKRTNTYPHTKKTWNASTPTIESGEIWQNLTVHAEVIFEYAVRCPHCGESQVMNFGGPEKDYGFKWPKDERDPQVIESKKLAWYECASCHKPWDDYQRDLAVRNGDWLAKGDGRELFAYLRTYNPAHIGFHVPSWLSTFISLSSVVASFLKGTRDNEELKDFCNNHKAEPWLAYHKDEKEEVTRLNKLKDDRPSGSVPGGDVVAALVAGVDTQDNGFFYKIQAIGYGLTQETWLVRTGFVTSFEALERVLWEDEYSDPSGQTYPVQLVVQDAMGHRTSDVYDFCCKNRGIILPSKGQRTKAQAFTYSNLEFYPGTKTTIPGGVLLVNVNVTLFKDKLSIKLEVPATDPGAYHLHAETDDDYIMQMTAEYRDENGFWECIGSRANHYWDCGVLALVAAEILGIKHWPKPGEYPSEEEPQKERPQGHNQNTGGRW